MSTSDTSPPSDPTVRLDRSEMRPVADTVAETLAALDHTIIEARGRRRSGAGGDLAAVAPGEVLGRFGVEGELGRGGMGQVVRARDPLLGRVVAVKVLGRDDPELEGKFVAEAVITGLLEHPSIIPVYELGFGEDGRPFLAMREVRGRTLATRLAELRAGLGRVGRDGLDHAELGALLRVYLKVCDAVELAHSRGVIHRDIKPANVMIGEFGEVYLLDWGLARLIRGDGAGGLVREALADHARGAGATAAIGTTLDGAIVGTPQYMSPEQARGEIDRMDERGDIYALGVVLYELASLAPAFAGDTVVAVIEDVAAGTWLPPSRRAGARRVPWELEAVIVRAMAFEPADRFQSVAELRGELERFLAGEVLRSASYSPRRMLGRVWSRHRVAIVLGALALGGAVGLLGYTMREIAAERDQARGAERAADAARSSAVDARAEAEDAARQAHDARVQVERAARREQADALALRARDALDQRALGEALLLASEALERGDTPLARALQLGLEPPGLTLASRWRIGSRVPLRTVGSADGVWIACNHGFAVEIWDLVDRRFAGRHEAAGRKAIRDVAWLDAPPRCVILGEDGVVVVQRVGGPMAEPLELGRASIPVAMQERLVALAASADGRWLYGGGERGELLRWPTGNTTMAIRTHHGGRIERLVAGADGSWLSAGSGRVCAWNDNGRTAELELDGRAYVLAIAPDGRSYAAAAGLSLLLGTDEAQVSTAQVVPPRALAALARGQDGRVLGGDDGARRRAWRADGVLSESVRAEGRALWLGVDAEDRYVDVGRAGQDLSASRWVARPGRDGRRLACASQVRALAFGPDGERLLVGGGESLELFALGTAALAAHLEDIDVSAAWLGADDMAWVATPAGLRCGSAKGPLRLVGATGAADALTVASDGTVLALDGAPALVVYVPGSEAVAIELDRRGATLAAGGGWWAVGDEGGSILMIDASTRTVARRMRADRGLDTLAVAPSGYVVAGANEDGLHLWDTRVTAEPRVLPLGGRPTALAFLDDTLLLVGDDRGVLGVWDVVRGHEVVAFTGHAHPVTSIATWGGRRVATAAGSEVRVWGLDGWIPSATARAMTGLALDGLGPRAVAEEEGWKPGSADALPSRWPPMR